MEGRHRRVGKTSLKGASGPARRSGCRGRDLVSPIMPCAATQSGDAAGTVTSKNALRERTRVESLRRAYLELQGAIPSVPPNTKLSKLDVLVLATSYISHLSHLLEEDNLRVLHDSNNNTTAPTAVSAGMEQSIHHSKSETTARGPQKGLLHPVKKWPMRARLYPGVAVGEPAMLVGEQPPTGRHLRSKLNTLPTSSNPYPVAQLGATTLQHPHSFENTDVSAGMPSEDPGAIFSDSSFVNGGVSGHGSLPLPYPTHYLGSWETDGPWVSDVVGGDLSACHQPWTTTYTGCWSSWQD